MEDGGTYALLNRVFREIETRQEAASKWAPYMNSLKRTIVKLQKLQGSIRYKTLFRGRKLNINGLKNDFIKLEGRGPAIISPGNTICSKALWSCSMNEMVAQSFAGFGSENVDRRTMIVIIESFGAELGPITHQEVDESEVLILPGTKFYVQLIKEGQTNDIGDVYDLLVLKELRSTQSDKGPPPQSVMDQMTQGAPIPETLTEVHDMLEFDELTRQRSGERASEKAARQAARDAAADYRLYQSKKRRKTQTTVMTYVEFKSLVVNAIDEESVPPGQAVQYVSAHHLRFQNVTKQQLQEFIRDLQNEAIIPRRRRLIA